MYDQPFDGFSGMKTFGHERRPYIMGKKLKQAMDGLNDFLDRYVLPWPVRFLTFRISILVTIGLLIPLIVYANNTVMVLSVNSYLNVMSVAVSSIVLLYATISEARQKQIAEMQEKRAQEDHAHVTDMHNLVLQTLQNQNIEMAELKSLLVSLAGRQAEPAALAEMPELQDLHPLGKERFSAEHLNRQWEATIHQNPLVSAIREDLPSPGVKKPDPAIGIKG